jgi:hypothetical protein
MSARAGQGRLAFMPRQGNGNAEARIQASIFDWAGIAAPDVLIFAIPNGGLRSKGEAARLKWTGVVAGIPDLAVVAPGGRLFFIEVKAPGNSLSESQKAMVDRLTALRVPFALARSIDDVRDAFNLWGLSTREAAR